MNKILLCIWLVIMGYAGSNAQSVKRLNVGDAMPAIRFTNVFNSRDTALNTEDWKGKLVIYDFWNIWCSSCIAAFPKMEKLQKEFGEKIKIVLVTDNSDSVIKQLFTRIHQPDLSLVVNDTLLGKLFPHQTVPHHVWVDERGIIQYITDGYNADAENIQTVLNGGKLNLHVKAEAMDFDESMPLWEEGDGRLKKYMIGYSYGMGRIEESNSGLLSFLKDTINGTVGLRFLNIDLLSLYKIAFGETNYYGGGDFMRNNRIVFQMSDPNALFYPKSVHDIDEWFSKNSVSYECHYPASNEKYLYLYLQQDLNRMFRYMVKVEERETSYFALTSLKTHAAIISTQQKPDYIYNDSVFQLKKWPITSLVDALNDLPFFTTRPVVNETGIKSNIDIKLNKAFTSFSQLQKELTKSGLHLQIKKTKLKMLVIRDK